MKNKFPRTNDRQIRAALKQQILPHYLKDPNTLIFDELGVQHGSSRIDVAVINGRMLGFEIKSDRDTLARLPLQASIFSAIFDSMTLVVGLSHVEQAVSLIPSWWGIMVVHPGDQGSVYFSSQRCPNDNPAIDRLAIAQLLWRAEALELLQELGGAQGFRTKTRASIYAQLAEIADIEVLRDRVRQRFRDRVDWRSAAQQTSSGD